MRMFTSTHQPVAASRPSDDRFATVRRWSMTSRSGARNATPPRLRHSPLDLTRTRTSIARSGTTSRSQRQPMQARDPRSARWPHRSTRPGRSASSSGSMGVMPHPCQLRTRRPFSVQRRPAPVPLQLQTTTRTEGRGLSHTALDGQPVDADSLVAAFLCARFLGTSLRRTSCRLRQVALAPLLLLAQSRVPAECGAQRESCPSR